MSKDENKNCCGIFPTNDCTGCGYFKKPTPREQILKRFTEEMQADFYTDPMFYQVVKSLETGADPYLLIGDILHAYKKLADENTNLIMNGPQPNYIVVTEERYNQIKENGKL